MVFIELPDFQKPADELQTNYEHWLYVLKYLANLKEMPDTLKKNKVFKKLFIEAEIANMTQEELDIYDKSIKNLNKMYTTRDIVNDWRREAIAARKENIAVKQNFIALQYDNIAKDNTIYSLQYDNIAKDNIIASKENTITEKENTITEKDNTIAEKDNTIADLQRKLQQAGLN